MNLESEAQVQSLLGVTFLSMDFLLSYSNASDANICIFTDRIRSMGEGYVFTGICLFTGGSAYSQNASLVGVCLVRGGCLVRAGGCLVRAPHPRDGYIVLLFTYFLPIFLSEFCSMHGKLM